MVCRRKYALFRWVSLLLAVAISFGACARSPFPAGVSRVGLVKTPRHLQGISWCPDGIHIAVGIGEGGFEFAPQGDIYLLNVADREFAPLTEIEETGFNSFPACSPDGKQVAFKSFALSPNGIWTVDISNSSSLQFMADGTYPAWSPEEQRLAFVRHEGKYGNWTDTISILDLETGDITEVFTESAERIGLDGLAWSPDGGQLAFSLGTAPLTQHVLNETNIYVLDLEEDELLQLTSGGGNDNPSWSPDGRLIAYMTGPTYSMETLVIARADGTCPVKPLGIHGLNWAAWSPDGTQIAFTWERGIYVMDVATVLGIDFLTTGPVCP